MSAGNDPRLLEPLWDPAATSRRRLRLFLFAAVPLAVWYFGWLVQPERVGNPTLYGLLLAAELFNLIQAAGFWWTISRMAPVPPSLALRGRPEVDVLIPVYGEPESVVEPTVAAAVNLRGAQVNVYLLDDGGSDEMHELAKRNGAGYMRRRGNQGAKAGNINTALQHTSAPFVVVLDCDHVPRPEFLERLMPAMRDERVALAQAPQYYANARDGGIPAAAWGQQALFFGAISRGKDAHGAMFCCGTNMVLRRTALESVGGFPTKSLTEDFELSVKLHERGWTSRYVPEVLASGLGPEDMSSYVSQQQRWARGCLGAAWTTLRARLPARLKLQYLLSSMYFLSGWTLLAYMAFPVIRMVTGEQPIAAASADQFLFHFAPYFAVALSAVAVAGAGTYTFAAFSLAAASFWVHVQATLRALTRRRGRFVVTPKRGAAQRQPRAVIPGLLVIAALVAASAWGLAQELSPSTLNNVAFAMLHVTVLAFGVRWALVRRAPSAAEPATPSPVRPRPRPRPAEEPV